MIEKGTIAFHTQSETGEDVGQMGLFMSPQFICGLFLLFKLQGATRCDNG